MVKKRFIFIIAAALIYLVACGVKEESFKVAIRNTTPYEIKSIEVDAGADAILFASVKGKSVSEEKILTTGGREVVNPIFVKIYMKEYVKDTTLVKNTIASLEDRKKLQKDKVNYIKAYIDSTQLPQIFIDFTIED
jgi:hypothetical protein